MNQGANQFFRKGAKININKQDINNTPIRQRDFNKENVKGQHNVKQQVYHTPITLIQRDSMSPYNTESSISNSRTVPKRRVSMVNRNCTNHPEVEA